MKDKFLEKNKKAIVGIIIGVIALVIVFFILKGCSIKEYTITFDSNGGTIIESIKVKENEKVKKPINPTKDGYVFDGWYYEDEIFDFNTKITKDITLKAYWNKEIELSDTELSLVVDSTHKLKILSLPDGLDEKDLIYSSSDESIVTVDESGNIKALKPGKATITIKSKDNKYTANCEVVVTDKKIEIESVSIIGSNMVTVGSSIKLTATFGPSNATSQKLTWVSSDSKIAIVDENGNVKGLKEGTVIITVTTENGKTATKKITVKGNSTSNNNNSDENKGEETDKPTSPEVVEPTNVEITGSNEVYVNNSIQLSAVISPSNATNQKLTWVSSDSKIATVDQNGKVTGIKTGKVTITVTTENGKTASYEIIVKEEKSTYVIYFTKRELSVVGGAIQYDFRVTKDGLDFTDYLGFEYNGKKVPRETSSIPSTAVEGGLGTAKLTLTNNQVVTATVKVN